MWNHNRAGTDSALGVSAQCVWARRGIWALNCFEVCSSLRSTSTHLLIYKEWRLALKWLALKHIALKRPALNRYLPYCGSTLKIMQTYTYVKGGCIDIGTHSTLWSSYQTAEVAESCVLRVICITKRLQKRPLYSGNAVCREARTAKAFSHQCIGCILFVLKCFLESQLGH